MKKNSEIRNPRDQEAALPLIPNPTQQPSPSYVQGVVAPALHQMYHPNQYVPGLGQPMDYQPAQHVVTVGTAPPLVGAPLQPEYRDYMLWSIVNMLFFCLPLGIAALIFSYKAKRAIARNDLNSAKSHSFTVWVLNIIATTLATCCYISIIFIIFEILSPSPANNTCDRPAPLSVDITGFIYDITITYRCDRPVIC
ncbi:unnamed protein product [Ranitomeya imitator]|uniref:Interferon-induced transmembrane protein n=1 Tax=Ranitomeya imitator TaxID=111125 RepID=A0ABN9M476_9NEOB|nr:unnamed protein product [Ranitomeya imitator]